MPALLATEIEEGISALPSRDCIIHYNLLRAFDDETSNINNPLVPCSIFNRLLHVPQKLYVYLLVAPRSEIIKLVLSREYVESTPLSQYNHKPRPNGKNTLVAEEPERRLYPHKKIFELLGKISLADLHRQWFHILEDNQIPYEIIDATNRKYQILSNVDEAIAVVNCDAHIP